MKSEYALAIEPVSKQYWA